MIRLEARPIFAATSVLGEGPLWHGEDLLWVDILEGAVLRGRGDAAVTVKSYDGPVSAVLPHRDGGYLVLQNQSIVRVDSRFREIGRVGVLPPRSKLRLADGTIGPSGELWFGTMRPDLLPGGSLYRLRAGESEPTEVIADMGMPNGIAFSPDGRSLYVVDSSRRSVLICDYDEATQEISEPRTFVDVDPELGTPDGIAVDAAGGVWVAMWAGGRLRRAEHDGTWSQEILVPAANVTSCAFGGANLQTLYITSATVELTPAERAGQPHAGSVFGISLPIGGLPQTGAAL